MAKILGISAFYHDAAAAMAIEGTIVAAAQEERFTRQKHCPDFPTNAIKFCLEDTGLTLNDLDAVVFYDKPLLTFERLLETYYAFSPKGFISFLKAIPVWLHEKLFLKKQLYRGLAQVEDYDKKHLKLLFTEHHLSHAAGAFYTAPFSDAALLTIDGVGEWSTASIGIAHQNRIEIIKEMHFPHSVGLLYSAFTYFLGFKVNSGEYKLMGLAPYGNTTDSQTEAYIESIKKHMLSIKEDGSIWLNQAYFNYATGLTMIKDKAWEQLFGFSKRLEGTEITQAHCNLALAIQKITETILLKMAKETQRVTGAKNLCMAGGVALNCVANGALLKAKIFDNIFIQPAAGDAGGALGAALAASYMYFDLETSTSKKAETNYSTYLGPEYSDKEIMHLNKRQNAVYHYYDNLESLLEFVATKITTGHVVGWFQGKLEFGPRALGNRSILADARDSEMQQTLNLKIKKRESFRPFAPSILEEDATTYFDIETPSPYMLVVAELQETYKYPLPHNFNELPLQEKLQQERSEFQSVTHLDFSSRLHTVSKTSNERYWKLLSAIKTITGVGMVINTSFNVRGEPIVCSPKDAYHCFMNTDMDYLVMNNFVYFKKEQPDWNNSERWTLKFDND
jgi:carbamoyltransferase